MVVTGIFRLQYDELTAGLPADSTEIYEEKIAQDETLVAVRAGSLHHAMLLSELLSEAGAEDVEIDDEAA